MSAKTSKDERHTDMKDEGHRLPEEKEIRFSERYLTV